MRTSPEAWRHLMGTLATLLGGFLAAQVKSGAGAVQIFDSWAGALSPQAYQMLVLPYIVDVVRQVADLGVPIIYFAVSTPDLSSTS